MATPKKKTVTRVAESKRRPVREFSNMDDILDTVMQTPGLREAFTRAELELALDDRGWERASFTGITGRELDTPTRQFMTSKSRTYWQRDPLAKQAVRLWTDYSVGDTLSYKAKLKRDAAADPNANDVPVAKEAGIVPFKKPGQEVPASTKSPEPLAPKAPPQPQAPKEQTDEATQKKLLAFFSHPRNRRMLNADGRRKMSNQLLIDGDLFLAFFDLGDTKGIRRIDPLQIVEIISDPEDEDHVLAYKRVIRLKSGKEQILYYGDWALDEEGKALAEQQRDRDNKMVTLEEDVVVYHKPFDSIARFGNGLLSSGIDWTREHRRFMEARVAITQALSKFAWKATVQGGQSVINSLKTRLESSLVSGPSQQERKPQNAPGATWLQNKAMELAPMPRVTGGTEAKDDSNNLKLMFCAAVGIMLHYFGDPSTGNLATATAMELPMLKQFGAYQTSWTETWRDIFTIVLDEDINDFEARAEIDIDLPPIIMEDLTKMAQFITAVAAVFPEIKIPEILQKILAAFGVNNIDEVMKSIEEKRVEVEAQKQQEQADRMSLLKSMPDPNTPDGKAQIKTMESLAESLKELAISLR